VVAIPQSPPPLLELDLAVTLSRNGPESHGQQADREREPAVNWAQIPEAARRNWATGAGLDPPLISARHVRPERAAPSFPSARCGRVVVVLALGGLALLVRWWCGCRAGLALAFVVVDRGDGSDPTGFGSHRRLRLAAGGWSFSAALCRCWWAAVEIRCDR